MRINECKMLDRSNRKQMASKQIGKQKRTGTRVANAMSLGIALGVGLGAAFDNMSIGIALGICFGAALGVMQELDYDKSGESC
jgi:hypothetical protein